MDEWFSSTGAKGAEETRRERWMNSTQDSWNSKIYWRFCSREVQILLFYGRCGTGMWQLTDIFVLRSWIKLYSLRFRVNFILYPASIVRISSVLSFQRQTQLLSFIHQSYLLSGILSARFIHTPNTFHGSVEINAIISKLSLVSLNFNQRPETHRVKSTQRDDRPSTKYLSLSVPPKIDLEKFETFESLIAANPLEPIVIGRITRIFRSAASMLVNKRSGYLNRDGRITARRLERGP